MTKREKQIIEIATEMSRLLRNGVEIHPNSPIHEKMTEALKKPVKNKTKRKIKQKEKGKSFFEKWDKVIKNMKI